MNDASDVVITNNSLARLDCDISLYTKKPSYDPGTARISGVVLHDVAMVFDREEGGALEVNNSVSYAVSAKAPRRSELLRIDPTKHIKDDVYLFTLLKATPPSESDLRRWNRLFRHQ